MSYFLSGKKIENEPNLLFDKFDASAVNPQVYWGLRGFGPYEKNITTIKVFIISTKTGLGNVTSLLKDLQEGVSILPGGLPKFFHCNLEIVGQRIINTMSVQDYEAAANYVTSQHHNKDIDVVLVYIPKTSRYFAQTPYYRTKGILASKGFCSQMITDSTFSNLKWSYLNLAIALFTKAGGIPWVLESAMPKTDMIIGIAVSERLSIRKSKGGGTRFIGYANIFDNNGRWMFFEGLAKSFEKGKNHEAVKEIVTNAIQKFKHEKNVGPKNISMHSYKRFGKAEKKAATDVIQNVLGDCNISFVSINDHHPFRLYDKTTSDGSFRRGYYVYFGHNQVLLSTTGETSLAGRRMGTPRLLHISFSSNVQDFFNIDEIAEQVFSLTKLDWATATPLVREPVTLQFSRAIADLTAAVSEQEWNSILDPSINTILNSRPWFI